MDVSYKDTIGSRKYVLITGINYTVHRYENRFLQEGSNVPVSGILITSIHCIRCYLNMNSENEVFELARVRNNEIRIRESVLYFS